MHCPRRLDGCRRCRSRRSQGFSQQRTAGANRLPARRTAQLCLPLLTQPLGYRLHTPVLPLCVSWRLLLPPCTLLSLTLRLCVPLCLLLLLCRALPLPLQPQRRLPLRQPQDHPP